MVSVPLIDFQIRSYTPKTIPEHEFFHHISASSIFEKDTFWRHPAAFTFLTAPNSLSSQQVVPQWIFRSVGPWKIKLTVVECFFQVLQIGFPRRNRDGQIGRRVWPCNT